MKTFFPQHFLGLFNKQGFFVFCRFRVLFFCALVGSVYYTAAAPPDSKESLNLDTLKMWYTTRPYQQAAVKVLIEEANHVCHDLRLTENLPIRSNDLTEIFIQSPFMSDNYRMLGTISTTNYHYAASTDNKLSSVVRKFWRRGPRRAQVYRVA